MDRGEQGTFIEGQDSIQNMDHGREIFGLESLARLNLWKRELLYEKQLDVTNAKDGTDMENWTLSQTEGQES